MTEVDPLRGFIRPTLRANRAKPRKILHPRFLIETYAAKPKKVGPMKPLQGPNPEGREALEWHPLRDFVKEPQTIQP
jgi:hypothetical protein